MCSARGWGSCAFGTGLKRWQRGMWAGGTEDSQTWICLYWHFSLSLNPEHKTTVLKARTLLPQSPRKVLWRLPGKQAALSCTSHSPPVVLTDFCSSCAQVTEFPTGDWWRKPSQTLFFSENKGLPGGDLGSDISSDWTHPEVTFQNTGLNWLGCLSSSAPFRKKTCPSGSRCQ